MAIRDGLSIGMDERTLQKAEGKKRRGKGKEGEPSPGRRATNILTAVAVVLILLVAMAYAFYSLRKPSPEPRLLIGSDKTIYSPGEVVNLTVKLDNDKGIDREYKFSTDQKFQLEIHNGSGSVYRYSPEAIAGQTSLLVRANEVVPLGTVEWNQTTLVYDGDNETYVQVTPGTYAVKAWLSNHADISAEIRFDIA